MLHPPIHCADPVALDVVILTVFRRNKTLFYFIQSLDGTHSPFPQILSALPENVKALVDSGALSIVITNLSPGSVVVVIAIKLHGNVSQGAMNVSQAVMTSLRNSSVYTVDNNTSIDGTLESTVLLMVMFLLPVDSLVIAKLAEQPTHFANKFVFCNPHFL